MSGKQPPLPTLDSESPVAFPSKALPTDSPGHRLPSEKAGASFRLNDTRETISVPETGSTIRIS